MIKNFSCCNHKTDWKLKLLINIDTIVRHMHIRSHNFHQNLIHNLINQSINLTNQIQFWSVLWVFFFYSWVDQFYELLLIGNDVVKIGSVKC